MTTEDPATAKTAAAQAVGRCYGALFFSVFGGAWLLLGAYAFGRLNLLVAVFIAAPAAAMVVLALRLSRRGRDAAVDAIPQAALSSSRRGFAIVNAVMWSAIFLLFQVLPRLGLADFAIPAVVLLVGLHFFVMPRPFRHRDNLVTGACLTVWAIVCVLVFHGDRMIAFASTGAGVILWASALRGLRIASQQLDANGI